jgi:hypothetical protein
MSDITPYTLADVERIEVEREKPYDRLRATVAALDEAREVLRELLDSHEVYHQDGGAAHIEARARAVLARGGR